MAVKRLAIQSLPSNIATIPCELGLGIYIHKLNGEFNNSMPLISSQLHNSSPGKVSSCHVSPPDLVFSVILFTVGHHCEHNVGNFMPVDCLHHIPGQL